MASWPRWVNDDTVDSTAMLEAYLYTRRQLSEEEQELLWLASENHLDGWMGVVSNVTPPGIVEEACREGPVGGCARCTARRGGYKFRWYDQRWYARYVQHRRDGAWVMGPAAPQTARPPPSKTVAP